MTLPNKFKSLRNRIGSSLLVGVLAAGSVFTTTVSAGELTLDEMEKELTLEETPPKDTSQAKSGVEGMMLDEDVELIKLEEQLKMIESKIVVTKEEIGKIRDATYLPDLYFSLADLHVQKSRVMFLLKIGKNPQLPQAEIDFTAEKRPKQDAIDVYQKIYSFFPKYARRDKALFLKGLELKDLGQVEQMIRTFSELSKEFPNSEHFNEANIILGDFFFEQKKDLPGAEQAFLRVINRSLSPFTPLAHYRLGWVYFNQAKHDLAIKAYEDALTKQMSTNDNELPESYRRTDIRREAVLALAVPYIEIYTDATKKRSAMVEPVDYFRSKSPDHFTYRRVLSRVGRRLILKEKWREAADCFFQALVLSTDFDQRFEALQRVNEAHKRRESKIDLLALIKETALTVDRLQAQQPEPIVLNAEKIAKFRPPVLGPLPSAKTSPKTVGKAAPKKKSVAKKEDENSSLRRPVNQLAFMELLMRDWATQLHAGSRKSGSPIEAGHAAEAYEIYLSRFPVTPKALILQLNLAETEFKADRVVKAGIAYERLAKHPRARRKANEFKESSVEAFTRALQTPESLSPVQRLWARRGLRAVGGDWIKRNPKHSGAPTVAFNIANSWYEERDLRKAIDAFKSFISKYPRDQRVRDAVFLVINSYSQLDDYKGLQTAGTQMYKTRGLSKEDQDNIREAVRRAQTKQIQEMAGNFGSKQYTENLLQVAAKYKGSKLGAQAMYEAFASLRSKRDPELFDVGETLLSQHADNQNAKEVASTMATLSLSSASYDRAARYLTLFADKYPGEKESPEFRKTSAALFERQGDFVRARAIYQKIGDRSSVARMDLAMNDWRALERSSVEAGGPDAMYHRALAVWRQDRHHDAAPLLRQIAGNQNMPPDRSGHAKYLLSQLALERFRSIKMKSAEDQQALLQKVKAFQALSAELQDLVKTSAGRWPIAALYLLGQTHYDLGRFIADSPLPQGLAAADKKAYMSELSSQAKQYLQEADSVFKKCLEAAETNEVFTRYVDGCRAKGRKLMMERDDLAKPAPKRAGSEPSRAKAIRRELFEKSTDTGLLFELGDIYIRADQPLTAAGIYSRILEIEPGNAQAIASQGVASLYLNEYDAAYEAFKRALSVDPRDATALYNLGGLHKQFGFGRKLAEVKGKISGVSRPRLIHPFARGL